MDIAFDSRALRTLCERKEVANQKLGTAVATALRSRLADLQAAASPNALPIATEQLESSRGARMALPLSDGYRLVLTSNHVKDPVAADGTLHWSRVTRVKILSIDSVRE